MENRNLEIVINFLKNMGIDRISEEEKNLLLEEMKAYSLEEYLKELEVIYVLNRIVNRSYANITIDSMYQVYNSIDATLYLTLFSVYNRIKKRCFDEEQSYKEFKKMAENILKRNSIVNKCIKKETKVCTDKVLDIKSTLFARMEDKIKAEKLFENCIQRSKKFVEQCDIKNLNELIKFLKANYEFTDDELVEISSRCATFFSLSSVSKIEQLQSTLNDLKEFIINQLNLEIKEQKELIEKLKFEFKEVLFNTASLTQVSGKSVNKTVRFLMGESLEEIDRKITGVSKSLKGNFTPKELAKIYSGSLSSLATSVEKISSITNNLSLVFKNCYGEELEIENLINGKNFASLSTLTTKDFAYDGKAAQIFSYLKRFVTKEEMTKLLQSDFSFLLASEENVKEALKNAIMKSRDEEDAKKFILKKIRNHFDMYQGMMFISTGEKKQSSIILNRLINLNLSNLEEDNLVETLNDLGVDDKEIEIWKSKWKKEKQENKELEIEIQLIDLLDEIEGLKELSEIKYIDLENFKEDAMTFRNMYYEIVEKYRNIIKDEEFPASLKQYSDEIRKELEKASVDVNAKFDFIIKELNEHLGLLVGDFSKTKDRIREYKLNEQQISQITATLFDDITTYDSGEENWAMYVREVENLFALVDECKEQKRALSKIVEKSDEYMGEFAIHTRTDEYKKHIINNGYDTAYLSEDYIVHLLYYCLTKDSLHEEEKAKFEIRLKENDKNRTFEEMLEVVDSKSKSILIKMMNEYKKIVIFQEDLASKIDKIHKYYDLDDCAMSFKSIETEVSFFSRAIGNMRGQIKKVERKIQKREKLMSKNEEINLSEIEQRLKELEDAIAKYNNIIENYENLKVKI